MKRMIILCSLFSVVNIATVDIRPLEKGDWSAEVLRLEKALQKSVSKHEEYETLEKQARKDLLQTEEGQAYVRANSDRLTCCFRLRENGLLEINGDCKESDEVQERALTILQQTEAYQNKYLPALNNRDYNARKIAGLARARDFVLYQSYQFSSETEAMLAGIKSMEIGSIGKPSKKILDSSNDLNKIEEKVKEELCNFLDKYIR
jgi:hypothetical protein